MHYRIKLMATLGWMAGKAHTACGKALESASAVLGARRNAAPAAGDPASGHPYLLLLPPDSQAGHPRG